MRKIPAVLSVLALTLIFGAGEAFAASISGTWRGNGTFKPNNGSAERVGCKVTYTKTSDGRFDVLAKCSIPGAGTFTSKGRVSQKGSNNYGGLMHGQAESLTAANKNEYKVTGTVSIRVNGTRQTVTASNAQGTARLSLVKK